MAELRIRPAARRDLERFIDDLKRDGAETAERFVEAFWQGFESLESDSAQGRPVRRRHLEYTGSRLLPLRPFESHLLLFRGIPTGVEAVRVIHGASQLAAWLLEEDSP